MNKKTAKLIGLLIFIAIVIVAVCNIYSWIVTGKQRIKINTASKAYVNSDLYVSIIAQKNGVDLETKTKLKLLNSEGKEVKNASIKYDGNNNIISIPDVEAGNYFIEAKVSSKAGKDTIKEQIYISNENTENVTITLDKGIYKPGDKVNYRALLTAKENDEPISKDVNVSIYDGNNNRVYNENLKSSDYGIISGNFALASEVNSGLYKLVVKTKNSQTEKQFKVNPYVTPKYEVKVDYDKENYLVGQTAQITFNAKYFFGEAVQNANLTVYINNEKYETLQTDSKGIAKINYQIKDAKKYDIKVEAVDSSNYFVEATSSFIAGTDIFEVELLPEYGVLAEGKDNNIYIFTSNTDGTPLKTYVTVSSNNFTKQVATDENGIGKFSIDIDKINANNYSGSYNNSKKATKEFSIVAEDTKGNTVRKTLSLTVEQKNLLVSTNKAKYEQGEDIEINISSINEATRNIYVFKNNKLIKMLSTDLENTKINLEDTYGLIDIYVTENIEREYTYYNTYDSNKYKKTIFINPAKKLNIDISTDKEEYKPGEKINISFNTVDENKTGVDSALLVSMLDNSVLNLANNDLSIDNIKLALQDIKFSNELDAASLYSCIVNNKSEQAIMALLLKQSNKDIRVSESRMYNYDQELKSEIISIISITIIAIIIITLLCRRFEKFRNILKHIINFIVYDFILVVISMCIIEGFFRRVSYSWGMFAIVTILGLTTYILLLAKLNKKIFRTSISIIITCMIFMLLAILISEFEVSPIVLGLIFAALFLIIVIVAKVSQVKKLKIDKYMQTIIKEILYILKFVGALVISLVIGGIVQAIIQIPEAIIPVTLICLYLFNYLFNKSNKEGKEKIYSKTISVGLSTLIILAVIGIIAVVYGLMYFVFEQAGGALDNAAVDSGILGSEEVIPEGIVGSLDSASTSSGNNFLDELLPTNKGESNTQQQTNPTNKEEPQIVKDDNIRNVFLESMCFIPELITSNGTANLGLDLSDNITTWTIQTIGNTKDGKIGYAVADNIKVFKDFFVDFELPKNLVASDKVSIPVTVYNYTKEPISAVLKIEKEDWFTLQNNNIKVNVPAKKTNMVYIPISILKSGNSKFRAEISSNNLTDIVEKECTVLPKGYKVEKVVSTGRLDKNISEDILILEDAIEGTSKAKVKIYASTMAQTVEGMENIFRMPTGCFEQISSSLYPNILALKYLEDNKIVDEQLKAKAMSYISSGYQKLLTYEVKGESGGYSLYGHSPAETVLTAYGLMEITDLSEVYNVDNSVIEKMTNFLYKKQNSNGTFTITGSHIGGANSRETLSLNAYITWALSESNPNDERLKSSVNYLKGKLDDIDDNYTLALVANVLANVKDKELNNVLKRLANNINVDGNNAYITSNISDYYGSRSNVQTVQTVALTSMALSKGSYNKEKNNALINYLISKKDKNGTCYTTQSTILALKALNVMNEKNKLENQTITVKVNSDEQKIEIKDNPLGLYELTFENLSKENKLNINIEKGSAYYEVIEEYYVPYEKVDMKNDNIEISVDANTNLKVNEILKSKVKVINKSENTISNGMVTISIPQGFTVVEESLMQLQSKGIIEKYETSYTNVNIYLRNFEVGQIVNLDVSFRASYPVEITGMEVKAYDYYNPEIEGKFMPIKISVKQ